MSLDGQHLGVGSRWVLTSGAESICQAILKNSFASLTLTQRLPPPVLIRLQRPVLPHS